jgi:O-antigen/teichoic acid export membrane protein
MKQVAPVTKRFGVPGHLVVAGSSWASRLVSVAVQLISIRVLLGALGLKDYSIFALLTGLQGWFTLADLGVGSSVQNYVSEARARGGEVAGLLMTARLLAVVLLLGAIGLLYAASPYIAPLLFKAFPALSEQERTTLFFVAGALSIGYGAGNIVYKIWYAQQRGYLSNVVPAVAAVIGLAGVMFSPEIAARWRLLYSLVAFIGPTALLPLGVLLVQLWRGRRRVSAPLPWWSVCRRAAGFWVFALMGIITLQTDYIVLSQLLAPRDIATYALASKVFGFIFFVYNALILALWPVLTELIVHGRWIEVSAYLRRYISIGASFVAVCTLALLWFMPYAIAVLAPRQGITVSSALIILMGVYWVVRVWADTFSILLQSMNVIRPFLVLVPIQAVLSCALQWTLAPRFGLRGIVLGLTGSFVLTVLWGLPVVAFRRFRREAAAVAASSSVASVI